MFIDRYRAVCSRCGFDATFTQESGARDYEAVKHARALHNTEQRGCPDDLYLSVTVMVRNYVERGFD